ncbi:YbgC/FadM family acyl-CoA thioesterase [Marinifilum sp. N1E240]|uniref:acyl-CoA thioesterase n=1 Tax=Marinifilum sp. N1E240 TaxID=2608082 RepID=UPI00128B7E57|nr:acyl-CoA thioesterase [Marinifilum sp. N1E240]MPQ47028.1 YbgC/FadM family acyl-CoA thioesterase [Marinifilum sp. N1E240]
MNQYIYTLKLKVRDYECDLQGVVNNSVYQNYLEHARHEFLESIGSNFKQLHEEGVDAMVSRIEIDYKTSLTSGDEFEIKLYVKREGVKLIFHEDIYRMSDNKLCAKGKVFTICLVKGRLSKGEVFDELFSEYLK